MDELLKYSNELLNNNNLQYKDGVFKNNELIFWEMYRFGSIIIASQQKQDKFFEAHTLLLCKNDLLYNLKTQKAPTISEIKQAIKLPKQINKEIKLSLLKTLCGIKCKKKKDESEDEEEVMQDDYDDNLDEEEEEDDTSEEVEEEEEEEVVAEEEDED